MLFKCFRPLDGLPSFVVTENSMRMTHNDISRTEYENIARTRMFHHSEPVQYTTTCVEYINSINSGRER